MNLSTAVGLVAATLIGCSASSTNDGGGDQLTPDERDTTSRGGDGSNASQQLAALADSLFQFDPTIDPAHTAAENAAAVEQRARGSLMSPDGGFPDDAGTLGCGSVSLSGTTVTVAFGPPPGCALRSGVTISGTVTVGLTKAGSTVTLALTLTQVVVNGLSLSGTASFATTNGTTFTTNASLTSGGTAYTLANFTVAGGAGAITVNGVVRVGAGDTATTTAYTTVTWRLGDCYPNSGSIASTKGLITTTLTFNAATPTTGVVTVTVGRKSSSLKLPSYGKCGIADGG